MKKLILILLTFGIASIFPDTKVIIDSDITLKEALKGTKAPKEIINDQIILDVEYYGFDNKLHRGQLVISKAVKDDIVGAFEIIKKTKFPIKKVVPIVKYGWSDNKSMEDNNTSAFNYRTIANSDKLSNHSFGKAIDFNPFQNPAVYNDGKISPKGATYDENVSGTLHAKSELTIFFKERGWRWGGDWTSLKDYQHFDKID